MDHESLFELIASFGRGSRKRLAEFLKVSQQTISGWKTSGVPVCHWEKIRQFYGISKARLLGAVSFREATMALEAGYFRRAEERTIRSKIRDALVQCASDETGLRPEDLCRETVEGLAGLLADTPREPQGKSSELDRSPQPSRTQRRHRKG